MNKWVYRIFKNSDLSDESKKVVEILKNKKTPILDTVMKKLIFLDAKLKHQHLSEGKFNKRS